MRQVSKIFKTKQEVTSRYNKFIRDWSAKEPGLIRTIKTSSITLHISIFLKIKETSLKSTNPLERINRKLRRITRRVGYFQNQRSLDIFIYLTLKEEGFIIDTGNGDMPVLKQNMVSLEFAKKCWQY